MECTLETVLEIYFFHKIIFFDILRSGSSASFVLLIEC